MTLDIDTLGKWSDDIGPPVAIHVNRTTGEYPEHLSIAINISL